ncbi:hypothetical protein [Streptomyces sp. NPDC057580]|uniref:hypothetical protein n=1 Tax=Streptomyces sp. NPDC057580 TaxID=3346173 RepID=UPI0036761BF7
MTESVPGPRDGTPTQSFDEELLDFGDLEEVEGQQWHPRRYADRVGDPHFPPVANGLDYLVSAVELLEGKGESASARDLKYAVLHLAAGAEVLLKARLQEEHWSLVFTNPGDATRKELEEGTLRSCTPEETRKRLTNIVGIAFSAREKDALSNLAHDRNALQHYGLVGQRANASAVNATTARVLHFLVPFVEEHLLPLLKDPEEVLVAQEDMYRIRVGLNDIEGYVQERLRDLAPQLGPVRRTTVQCLFCRQWTMVVPGGYAPAPLKERAQDVVCLYCREAMDAVSAAYNYNQVVLGRPIDPEDPDGVHRCFECRTDLLVEGALTAADRDRPVALCFGCSAVFDNLEQCQRCGALVQPEIGHRCSFGRSRSFLATP